MTTRFGQTRTGTAKLLKIVGGKPYATDDDHEENVNADSISSCNVELRAPGTRSKPLQSQNTASTNEHSLRNPPGSNRKRKADQPLPVQEPVPGLRVLGAAKKTRALKDSLEQGLPDDVNHEPLSSSDEGSTERPNPAQSAEADNIDGLKKPGDRKRKAGAPQPQLESEPILNVPGTKKKTRATAPRVPQRGQYQRGRAAKEGIEIDKENSTAKSTPTPPTSSQGNVWEFNPLSLDSSQGSQSARRKMDYSSRARAGHVNTNIHAGRPTTSKRTTGAVKYGAKGKTNGVLFDGDDEDLDNISMEDEHLAEHEPTDPELRKVPKRKKKLAQTTSDAPDLREQLGLTDTPYSSLPPSSAPQQDMDNIDSYVRELPTEGDQDTVCSICYEPVSQEAYWTFWKGLPRTVKNQALFCTAHRRASAAAEYASEGYPTIDWSRLSERIKKHRMALYSILTNDTPSPYRQRYEPLALTGKAAAVPSKRTDLSPLKQDQLASHALDDAAVYPGYYGPRGRRAITECVMSLLSTEIKRSTDPVVQTSGPATFVQAVLVPEVAVRLIMEDGRYDREQAEEVRERTFEMGILLNEEIEDEVLVEEEDDDDDDDDE